MKPGRDGWLDYKIFKASGLARVHPKAQFHDSHNLWAASIIPPEQYIESDSKYPPQWFDSSDAPVTPTAAPAAVPSRNGMGETPPDSVSEAEADRQLNIAYTALRKSMTEVEKQNLKREQVEWLKQRDTIAERAARLNLIQQRTAELKRRIGK